MGLFLRALLIASLAASVGWVHSSLRPIEVSWQGKETSSKTDPNPNQPDSSQKITTQVADGFIDLLGAKARHEMPIVVFVDASNVEDFLAGHIPGAWNLPLGVFAQGEIPPFVDQVSRGLPLVIYCSSETCDAAQLVALRLREFGYSDIVIFREGFKAWKAAGHAVQTGR